MQHLARLPVLRHVPCCMLLALTGCAGGGSEPAPGPGNVVSGTTSYHSGGRTIKVETFMPSNEARLPAVLVLYGSGGAVVGKRQMTDFARTLAQHGMAAFVVHYFNRTGTVVAAGDGAITRHWKEWEAAVADGVGFVAAHPRVRADRIGVFGYSLGAYLALAQAGHDRRIKAVVEIAGGIFDERRGKAARFPPTLVLHGREDRRVPVARVSQILADARKTGAEPEVHLYDHEGHVLSPGALADASRRSLAFLTQHLRR